MAVIGGKIVKDTAAALPGAYAPRGCERPWSNRQLRKQSMTTILQDCHITPRSLRNHAALQGLADFDINAAAQNRTYLPNDPKLAADMKMSGGMSGRNDRAAVLIHRPNSCALAP